MRFRIQELTHLNYRKRFHENQRITSPPLYMGRVCIKVQKREDGFVDQ